MSAESKVKDVTVRTSPNLALIKYWGKQSGGINLPAVSSLGITLDGLNTLTRATHSTETDILLNGEIQDPDKFQTFFEEYKKLSGKEKNYHIETQNNFPTAAGIASSSSGFAALAWALNELDELNWSPSQISSLARIGSGSASRAVFGGFCEWRTGALGARKIQEPDYWPELRILLAVTDKGSKAVSSRNAMNLSRDTSPFYPAWLDNSEELFNKAREALTQKDLGKLGPLIQSSYLSMFATMFTSSPPVRYWNEKSILIQNLCEELRNNGLQAWETMDAGPQVKIICLSHDEEAISERLRQAVPELTLSSHKVGAGPETVKIED